MKTSSEDRDAPQPCWPWSATCGLVLWAAAVASAFWAQYLLTPRRELQSAAAWYVLAAALAVVGMALIDRDAPLAEPQPLETPPIRWRWNRCEQWAAVVLLLMGVGANAICIHLVQAQRSHSIAFWLWVGSLLLATAAMAVAWRNRLRLRLPRPNRSQLIEMAVVLSILVLAVALRLPELAQIPPEVHGDEAECGLEARRVLHGQVPSIFNFGWYGVPYMSFGISAAFMRLFGDDLYGLRTASVFQGTLSVLLAYLVVKRLFTVRVAALAAFLLAVSPWHIHFSRSGINYMQALVATVLFFLFLLRGIDTQRGVDFLLAGFAAGLCFEVYFAARLAPVLGAIYLLYRTVSERGFLRRRWTGLVALGLGAVLFLAPMTVAYARTPRMFLFRMHGVFLSSPENQRHELDAYRVSSMKDVLRIQAFNSLIAFNFRGETSGQYCHGAPLIDFWTSALFVLGGVVSTLRAYRARYFFLAIWFWLTLFFGSVLTVDALFSPRVIAIIPVLFIFSALTVDAGWRAAGVLPGRLGTYAFAVPVAAFLLLAARTNYRDYFDVHIQRLQPAGFNTTLVNVVESINDRYRVYLLGGNENSFQYGTERFLIPDVDAVNVANQPLQLPLDRVPAEKGVVFLVISGFPDSTRRLEKVKEAYPGGREDLRTDGTRYPFFYIYVVEHDRLVAAQPDAELDHERIPGLWLSQVSRPRRARAAPAQAP